MRPVRKKRLVIFLLRQRKISTYPAPCRRVWSALPGLPTCVWMGSETVRGSCHRARLRRITQWLSVPLDRDPE
ncbi:hypothetical protein KCP73_07455 [Salmonella enterica subsp. enterica]|nr:hypothetical protein KCP73_07455 [Salmonella enterica subsp. enterica]